jgi:chemotaxis protein MotA
MFRALISNLDAMRAPDLKSLKRSDKNLASNLQIPSLNRGHLMRTIYIAIAAAVSLAVGLLFFASVSLSNYIDPVAFLIVGGGTVLVTVLRSGLAPFVQSLSVICRRNVNGAARLDALASAFHEMALIARRDGPVALEHHKVDDPFLTDGLARFVDGADEDRLRLYLERELARLEEHHAAQVDCWRGWIDHAPAMGLIGTIIGLVGVLGNLTDPQAIGPALGLALLTTLYGAMLANLVGVPVLARLQRRLKEERDYCDKMTDGLCVLARGGSSRQMREVLQPHALAKPVLKLVGNG